MTSTRYLCRERFILRVFVGWATYPLNLAACCPGRGGGAFQPGRNLQRNDKRPFCITKRGFAGALPLGPSAGWNADPSAAGWGAAAPRCCSPILYVPSLTSAPAAPGGTRASTCCRHRGQRRLPGHPTGSSVPAEGGWRAPGSRTVSKLTAAGTGSGGADALAGSGKRSFSAGFRRKERHRFPHVAACPGAGNEPSRAPGSNSSRPASTRLYGWEVGHRITC